MLLCLSCLSLTKKCWLFPIIEERKSKPKTPPNLHTNIPIIDSFELPLSSCLFCYLSLKYILPQTSLRFLCFHMPQYCLKVFSTLTKENNFPFFKFSLLSSVSLLPPLLSNFCWDPRSPSSGFGPVGRWRRLSVLSLGWASLSVPA